MERFAITSTEDAAGQLLYSVLSKTQVFPLNVYMYSHVLYMYTCVWSNENEYERNFTYMYMCMYLYVLYILEV